MLVLWCTEGGKHNYNTDNDNNNNNTIYISPIKSEDTEVLGDAGLSLTKQMCL